MQTNELKNRAERLVARAEALPNLGMMQRAEQAVILAQETAAIMSAMASHIENFEILIGMHKPCVEELQAKIDAMTPYIDEA